MGNRPKYGIKHNIKPFAHVFSQYAHHHESMLLQALVFGAVAPVGFAVTQMLCGSTIR